MTYCYPDCALHVCDNELIQLYRSATPLRNNASHLFASWPNSIKSNMKVQHARLATFSTFFLSHFPKIADLCRQRRTHFRLPHIKRETQLQNDVQ